jgi:hypothetical protein
MGSLRGTRTMPLAWRALLAAYLVGLALAHTTGDEEGEFKEPVLNISHLRGRTSEIGEDDIWENNTVPSLRCQISAAVSSGCTSAPSCGDRSANCLAATTKSCQQTYKTQCRGCLRGAPGCPSGYSCTSRSGQPAGFAAQGGGAFCSAACCYRIGVKTHTRSCSATSCAPCASGKTGPNGGPCTNCVLPPLAHVRVYR